LPADAPIYGGVYHVRLIRGDGQEMWRYIGMTNIQVDTDCKVRFNCYNSRDYLIENKGGKNEKTNHDYAFGHSALFCF
jgi:hypothetical protein